MNELAMLSCPPDCSLCFNPAVRVPDFELIDRILAGDSSMFEILCHRYCARLYRVAVAILVNETEAEDAVQQACVNAWLHLRQFERRSTFSTWFTSIAMNVARARLRPLRASIVEQLEEGAAAEMRSPDAGPEEECLAAELGQRLQTAVEALPPNYRTVFELRRNEGLSTDEVSRHLGVARDVVKTRLYRAGRMLKASIERR